MELKYKKSCDLDVIHEMLMLDPIYDDFESIDFYEYDPSKDNIIIKTKRHFYSHEIDQVTSIIESYSMNHPLVMRKMLEDNVATPAIIIGKEIFAKYAAMNLYKNKTVPQYLTMFDKTQKLRDYLSTGSLELAILELEQIKTDLPPDGSITNDECDEFIRRIQVQVARLKG